MGLALIFGLSAVCAEPVQITIVDGSGNLDQTQDAATHATDFLISGNLVGETTRADLLPGEIWNMRFASPTDSFLLRILDPSGTRILGSLNIFNGLFAMLNTRGIDIGPSGKINVNNAVFIASTLDIQNHDFLSGNYVFSGFVGAANKALCNHGLIRTTGSSSVILLGPAVENTQAIEAPLSRVALASGDAVTLSLDADGLISVDVTEPVKNKVFDINGREMVSQISNTGTIDADGGMVLVSAKALNAIFDQSVNLEGRIRANKAEQGTDGMVRITASHALLNSGTLEAKDGEVHLTSGGLIKTTGFLWAHRLFEKGFTFQMGGVTRVGAAFLDNIDGAADIAGAIVGNFYDTGDIRFTDNVTLLGDTTLWADWDDPGTGGNEADGVGRINMQSYGLSGGGSQLTLYTGQDVTLNSLTGLRSLVLNASSASIPMPVYTMTQNISLTEDMVIQGVALNAPASMRIGGDWVNNGGVFNPGTGTVIFTNTDEDQAIRGTATSQSFYDLAVAKGNKTLSIGGGTTTLNVQRNLILYSGLFTKGTASTFNIKNVLIDPFGGTQFYGLTLDADTVEDIDVAHVIGDTIRSYYPITDDVLIPLVTSGTVKTLIIGIPKNAGGYEWLTNYWGGNVPAAADRVTMDANNYIAYLTHVKDVISSFGANVDVVVEFGNEYNLGNNPLWFGATIEAGKNVWFSALTTAVNNVHAAFGSSIRVSTASGDAVEDYLRTINTGVDIVGMNFYRGLGYIDDLIADWNEACNSAGRVVPLYVSEAGAHSFLGEDVQNDFVVDQWDEILEQNIGVTFMSFEDNSRKPGSIVEQYWGWWEEDGDPKTVAGTMSTAWQTGADFSIPEFEAGSAAINVSGSWSNKGGVFDAGTSTVTFNATTTGNTIESGDSSFHDVVFNDGASSGAWTIQTDAMDVDGDLTVASGMVHQNAELSVAGDYSQTGGTHRQNAAFAANGNFLLSGGTFLSDHTQDFVWTDFSLTGGRFNRFTGTGTVDDPYRVYDVYGLQGLGTYLASGTYFKLANDIDASLTSGWNGGSGFVPIGSSANKFHGVFDGASHEISQMYIYRPAENYVGLFGNTDGATIRNVDLIGGQTTGDVFVGALVGVGEATLISHVSSSGTVTGGWDMGGLAGDLLTNSMLTGSHNSGNLMGGNGGGNIGGLVGVLNESSITGSYNVGTVAGGIIVGGVAGEVCNGVLEDSYNTGTVTAHTIYSGGLSGYVHYNGIVRNSYNAGDVDGANDTGGLVGYVLDSEIENSYNTGHITGEDTTGGLVGTADDGASIKNSYNVGIVSGDTETGGLIGQDRDTTLTNTWYVESPGVSGGVGNSAADPSGAYRQTGETDDAARAAFNLVTHPVYAAGQTGGWDIFAPAWDMYGTEYPHLSWENYGTPYVVWNGNSSVSWDTAANWSTGVVPSDLSRVLIFDRLNDPLTASLTTIHSLDIYSGRLTLGSRLTVNDDLNIHGGTLDAAGMAIDLLGDWRNAATFIHGNNTVSLLGNDQSLFGNNTFYNLSKTSSNGSTLTVEAGSTQAVEGTLTLKGAAGTRMLLRSDDPSSPTDTTAANQWSVSAASVDMSLLDVKDVNNTGSTISLSDSTDSGNNNGFRFSAVSVPWWDTIDLPALMPDVPGLTEERLLLLGDGTVLIEDERAPAGIVGETDAADRTPADKEEAQAALFEESALSESLPAQDAGVATTGGCGTDVDRAMGEACRDTVKTKVETISGEAELLGSEPGMTRPLPTGILLEIDGFMFRPVGPMGVPFVPQLSKVRTAHD